VSLRIRTRLTLWYVALLALILVGLAIFLVLRLRADLVGSVDRSLDLRAAQISLGFRGSGEGEFQDVGDPAFAGLPQAESASQVVSAGGAILESSGDPIAKQPMILPAAIRTALAGTPVRATVSLGPDGEPFRVLGVPAPGAPASQVLVVAAALESVDGSVERLAILLLIAGPAALAAAGVGGWWLSRKALRPVAKMTEQAAEIGIDRLDQRVQVPRSTDELGHLARTFNAMLERLEGDMEDKRRFIADASHELRTPLAVMRSELDVSLDADRVSEDERVLLESVREEVDRMSRIVERLLILARIDEGELRLLRAPIRLRPVIETVVRRLRPLAEAKSVIVEIAGDDPEVDADRERLVLAVETLVENAIKYTAPEAGVLIGIDRRVGEAIVSVVDEGPGLPADAIPLIFERFYRVDGARSRGEGGSGLGLAICHEIVQAHGGRVWAESTVGGGSSFFIALDASRPHRHDDLPSASVSAPSASVSAPSANR
jgi:two-component system, OmpR family, sensor kinase